MIEKILSVFFPNRCPYCGELLKAGMTECELCFREFPSCPKKMVLPVGMACVAPFAYEAKIRDSLIRYKFKGRVCYAKSYIKAVCYTVEYFSMQDSFDIVTFVPLSVKRRNERGFNQSELIAKGIAMHFGKECRTLLRKVRHNHNQHDLGLEERKENVRNVYAACHGEQIRGMRILLVDDIATTGNTLAECSRVLLASGADSVQYLTIAIAGAV